MRLKELQVAESEGATQRISDEVVEDRSAGEHQQGSWNRPKTAYKRSKGNVTQLLVS